MDEHHSRFERLLVGLVICVLVGLPLPLGSNRDWAIGIFVAVLGAIGLGCAIVRSRQRAPRAGDEIGVAHHAAVLTFWRSETMCPSRISIVRFAAAATS